MKSIIILFCILLTGCAEKLTCDKINVAYTKTVFATYNSIVRSEIDYKDIYAFENLQRAYATDLNVDDTKGSYDKLLKMKIECDNLN